MGTEEIGQPQVSLVIFTCENREHLLAGTIASFLANCNYRFSKTLIAIDGQVDPGIFETVKPDLIVQQYQRSGYVSIIEKLTRVIDTPYFFWLEDDWSFNKPLNLGNILTTLVKNEDWAQIILSKFHNDEQHVKEKKIGEDLYLTSFGFSANPCLCRTEYIAKGFGAMINARKGDTLGEDGFENFLTRYFNEQKMSCVLNAPDHGVLISHEGYLESTPRNWHMTNSLGKKTPGHLMTIPFPAFHKRLWMMVKLLKIFVILAFRQLFNEKTYEYCFRVMVSSKTIKRDD